MAKGNSLQGRETDNGPIDPFFDPTETYIA